MKTTITKNVSSWMSSYSSHLEKLNNLQKKWAKNGNNLPEFRELHIYVKDVDLSEYSNWISAIKSQYPNIKNDVISSIEKEFSL